jgi:hypothetical protein
MRGSEHLEDTKSIIHLLLDKERPSKQEQRNAANQDSATLDFLSNLISNSFGCVFQDSMAFRVGDPVHAVKAKNRQNNLYPGVVVKVRTLADNTSEPLGIVNVCCRRMYHCVTCGLCGSETLFYDVHFTTGEVEDRIPSSKVFAAPIEQPR